ncbi:MAG: UDP-N-acetylmuramate dehydrogenase [Defluviitaleaceae bacterium]|nr:UDP-N-acetylmuramate dehydrogenase [Defluviitaleaceae bacterium]
MNHTVEVHANEPMSRYTTFGIGGTADLLAKPKNLTEFLEVLKYCNETNTAFTVLGDGSNVLVSDNGIRGVVIITNQMNAVEILPDHEIRAQAGARLSKVAETAANAAFDGFAFASGIPGTVGGAVYMNAGAYGHDIGAFCKTVTLCMPDGKLVIKTREEMQFGYRSSAVMDTNMTIVDATFQFVQGTTEKIREEMKTLNAKRKASQPLEFRSAGSTFKRPEGYFAGKLIQDSLLKGFTIGGAQVSEKHAGFVINKSNATAQDVMTLIETIRQKVHENFGVWLEPEVRILGDV